MVASQRRGHDVACALARQSYHATPRARLHRGRIVGTLNVILYADPSALTGDASLAPRPRVGLQWPQLGASPGQPTAQLEPVRHFS
jgi:hypothetical protein